MDIEACGVDLLITAPQKGWSSTPGFALVMLSHLAHTAIESTTRTSLACHLRKWLSIREAYEKGGHAYHATLGTDSLTRLRDTMKETERAGFENTRAAQQELGNKVRALLTRHGFAMSRPKAFSCKSNDLIQRATSDQLRFTGPRSATSGRTKMAAIFAVSGLLDGRTQAA